MASSPPGQASSSSSSSSKPPEQLQADDTFHPPTVATAVHPLLPPVSSAPFAAEIDPYEEYHARKLQQHQSPVPEKCLTFCSQRADAPPLCRMFCLRKRPVQVSQAQELARLRPPPIRRNHDTLTHESSDSQQTPLSSFPAPTTATPSTDSRIGTTSWSPFEALRRKLYPYSFIYVRGTQSGVVGRYMEEMEYDDGQHDFGNISRGAEALSKRRREEPRFEWFDWGEHGTLLHIPLVSLFHPILSIPTTLEKIFSPSRTFLNKYYDSFTDGAQVRGLERFVTELRTGGAVKMLHRINEHLEKRAKKRVEEQARAKEARMDEKLRKVGKDLDGNDKQ